MLKLKDSSLFRQQVYVAGEWVDADDGSTVAVTNPADGKPLGTVPMCGAAETEHGDDRRQRTDLQFGHREEPIGRIGEIDPDHIHTPGIFVQRIVHCPDYEKRIEQRTVRER